VNLLVVVAGIGRVAFGFVGNFEQIREGCTCLVGALTCAIGGAYIAKI
jgi:CO dehydrogenase nickel-insertion accessory protein CooC1